MAGPIVRVGVGLIACALSILALTPSVQATEPQQIPISAITNKAGSPPPPAPDGSTSASPIGARAPVPTTSSTPVYSALPGFQHGQCVNACQMRHDAGQTSCRVQGIQGAALLACIQQASAQMGSCANACPVDAKRLQ